VTLEKRREGSNLNISNNKPDPQLSKQLEEERAQYKQKLRNALDMNTDIESQ